MKKAEIGMGLTIIGIIFCGIVVVCMAGFDVVDASHIGVKNRFGVIKGTMNPGMQWTGLFTSVEQYDLRIRKTTVEMLTAETTAVDKDGQTIKARIQINYRLSPDNIIDAYSKVGRDKDLAGILNLDGIIREGFKSTTSNYKSKEIWQNRQKVKEESIKNIEANFPSKYFKLENVIISDIDFNPAFIAAIESQKTNEELAIAEEKAVEIAKQSALRKIEIANGDAESQKLYAEAEAYQRLVLAQAEAESLKLKRQHLTPEMVQNNWIDAWDGKLPQFLMSSENQPNMLINTPPMEQE